MINDFDMGFKYFKLLFLHGSHLNHNLSMECHKDIKVQRSVLEALHMVRILTSLTLHFKLEQYTKSSKNIYIKKYKGKHACRQLHNE